MCTTRYINNLFAAIPSSPSGAVQVSMKRSDGELFTARLTMLTDGEAEKIKNLLNYFEELRTCSCTKDSVCGKHSDLRKVG
jgi:hypothetical protein